MVLGPVWLQTKDPVLTWQVGMANMVCMGLVKTAFAFWGDWIRRTVPKAGLIGSLGGVGLGTLEMLGHGFILTTMFWGAAVAHLIDRKALKSAAYWVICAVFTWFGLIHSAASSGGLYLPWKAPNPLVHHYAVGYLAVAAIVVALDRFAGRQD